ncbi:hypothetical protein C8J57DRAFT_138259 [Mycena rebaudengoi]|nr:hypothetical protein C8J57DRAFT_138259 [Mycena rebaudengoi]
MSDSVAVLRARLADISANITRQRKVLEDLERSRTDTQRQLNSMLDPIGARLPVEISSEIFILCLPDSGDRHPNPATASLLLLRICTAWADIARSTPALWDTIHVQFPCPEGFENLFHSYLARAQSRGLALTGEGGSGLTLDGRYDEDSFALLWPESALPNLKALTLHPPVVLSPVRVLSMLRATPGLVECTLTIAHCGHPRADSLTLPCLRSLSLGEESVVSDIYILNFLSLPALHTLSIPYIQTEPDVALLISFLARLEAPLQSLRVGFTYTKLQSEAYTQLLDLVPTLKCLRLTLQSASEGILVLNLLQRSSQGFIPELRDLTVFVCYPDQHDFHPVYELLSVRRSQIKSFRFLFYDHHKHHYLPLPPDVLHRLRQLAAECGMKIHFGTMDTNYI